MNMRHKRRHLNAAVLKRDRGVCAKCRLDTLAAWDEWANIWPRTDYWESFWFYKGYPPDFPSGRKRQPWEADHIIPVAEGGTSELCNFRTLCVPCHAEESLALCKRMAAARRAT